MGATPTFYLAFYIKVLCLVTNLQQLERFIQWNELLIKLCFSLLGRFAISHFAIKVMPLVTIDVELLHNLNENN